MESYIRISTLNDFVFCPKSIYYHELYQKYNTSMYHEQAQVVGSLDHMVIDSKTYSTSKNTIQWIDVFCGQYQLCWKIDLYLADTHTLIERKSKVHQIYPWQILQLRAQYFCMIEMWHRIDSIKLYSLQDNTSYPINIPWAKEIKEFEDMLIQYRAFRPDQDWFEQNPKKCAKCIYKELCDYYLSNHAQ